MTAANNTSTNPRIKNGASARMACESFDLSAAISLLTLPDGGCDDRMLAPFAHLRVVADHAAAHHRNCIANAEQLRQIRAYEHNRFATLRQFADQLIYL